MTSISSWQAIIVDNEHRSTLRTWLDVHGFKPIGGQDRFKDRAAKQIAMKIWQLIERHGETGYGDKPTAMHPVDYWLAHIEYNDIYDKELYVYAERV